mgnify:CR=1 FL=1
MKHILITLIIISLIGLGIYYFQNQGIRLGQSGTILVETGESGRYYPFEIGANGKVLMASSTATYKVSWETVSGGSGISSLNGLSGGTQTFSTSSDTNINLRIVSSVADHQFRPVWIGTLDDSRITSAVNWNSKATSTLTISAGLGMSGGGDLTANRTLTLNMAGGVCSGSDKISTITATGTVVCSADLQGSGSFTTTTINGISSVAYTFATGTDSNIVLTITTSTNTVTFNPSFTGTLADSRITSAATWNAKITTSSLSETIIGIDYNNTTGVFSLTSGYGIPLIASTTNFQTAYNWGNHATAGYQATITDGTGLTFSGATLNCDTASSLIQGCLTSVDWTTFNNKQNNISFPLPYASTTHVGFPIPYASTTGVQAFLGFAPASSTLTLTASTGLSGGGDLTTNRTFTLNMAGGTCTGTDKISAISAVCVITCTTDETAAGGTPKINPVNVPLVMATIWTNMPAARSEFGGAAASSSFYRTAYDFTSSTKFRLITSNVVGCLNSGTQLWMMYSSSTLGGLPASPWNTLANGGATSSLSVGCSITNVTSTAWANITTGALRDVWLKIEGGGGNGTVDPNFSKIILQAK